MTEYVYTCTLGPEELRDVESLYERAAEFYQGTVVYKDSRALVTLCGDRERIAALLDDMIARESACCTHLRFEPAETADGYSVKVRVFGEPDIAGAVLRATVPLLFPAAGEVAG